MAKIKQKKEHAAGASPVKKRPRRSNGAKEAPLDLRLVCDEQTVLVSSLLLCHASRSEAIQEIITNLRAENPQATAEAPMQLSVPGDSAATWRIVWSLVDDPLADHPGLTWDTLEPVILLADKYLLVPALQACEVFIVSAMAHDNVLVSCDPDPPRYPDTTHHHPHHHHHVVHAAEGHEGDEEGAPAPEGSELGSSEDGDSSSGSGSESDSESEDSDDEMGEGFHSQDENDGPVVITDDDSDQADEDSESVSGSESDAAGEEQVGVHGRGCTCARPVPFGRLILPGHKVGGFELSLSFLELLHRAQLTRAFAILAPRYMHRLDMACIELRHSRGVGASRVTARHTETVRHCARVMKAAVARHMESSSSVVDAAHVAMVIQQQIIDTIMGAL